MPTITYGIVATYAAVQDICCCARHLGPTYIHKITVYSSKIPRYHLFVSYDIFFSFINYMITLCSPVTCKFDRHNTFKSTYFHLTLSDNTTWHNKTTWLKKQMVPAGVPANRRSSKSGQGPPGVKKRGERRSGRTPPQRAHPNSKQKQQQKQS